MIINNMKRKSKNLWKFILFTLIIIYIIQNKLKYSLKYTCDYKNSCLVNFQTAINSSQKILLQTTSRNLKTRNRGTGKRI